MAKILLISINDVNAEGLRILSAVLKRDNHQSHIAFLKRYGAQFTYALGEDAADYDWAGVDRKGRQFRYCRGSQITATERELLLSLVADINPQLIGFSVTTPLRKAAAEISQLLRSRFRTPIVWGGPDPTISAEDCLAYCDFVCIGEGEGTIADIAVALDNNTDLREVNNLAYLADGKCVRNPVNPLIHALDAIPFKDIDKQGKFLIDDDSLVSNFDEVSYSRNYRYHVISSRGCPHKCSYCCEEWYKRLYSKQAFLRRRSVSNVICELKAAKETTGCKYVQFEDEVFSYDCDWLLEFRDQYRSQIGLPFGCYIYPNANIERQLTVLKEAGLVHTCLALQSGSERINKEVFHRVYDRDHLINTARLLTAMGIGYYTDVITFNPFETEEDLQATLDVLNELPKPFDLCVNKLYAVPGTKIFDLLENRKRDNTGTIAKSTFVYYSRLFWLATHHSRRLVTLVQKLRVFRHLPFLFTWLEWAKPRLDRVAGRLRRTCSAEGLRQAAGRLLPIGTRRRQMARMVYCSILGRKVCR
jgi:anaerobic magnesium-protoporphyrin IX monomethyl ester cyclase